MKIKSENFEDYIKNNYQKNKIIFLYGSNFGLVELLYNKSIKLLNINIADPFNVSKINGGDFKENPSILEDNINTLSIFLEKKFILLDLLHVTINKHIENIILDTVVKEDLNYVLIIKAGNIGSQHKLVKHFEKLNNSIITPCYEENSNKIKSEIRNLFLKHKVSFSNDFILHLSTKFSSDSLSNKMEIEKLDSFLTNNNNVSENSLTKFITSSEDINLTQIVKTCLNGETKDSLFYLDKIYEKSNSNIVLIRMFGKHFKTIEKILLLSQHEKSFSIAIDNLKPPIFFKDKPFFLYQCKLWSYKKISLIQKRLIDLELKTKTGLYPEKTLLSQFILSVSVLAKKKART